MNAHSVGRSLSRQGGAGEADASPERERGERQAGGQRALHLAGATGSRYSLLPPENASGNYVKVVQRIPVRIRIDPGQPELERLRPGMSVEPKVRVR